MYGAMAEHLRSELDAIRKAGLYKEERQILTPQGADIRVRFPESAPPREVINFCANNYLGLSSNPKVIEAAHDALKTHGFGLSSVRFICGTQDIHKQLERRISEFLRTEDTVLYAACFDANGGLFEPLLGEHLLRVAGEACVLDERATFFRRDRRGTGVRGDDRDARRAGIRGRCGAIFRAPRERRHDDRDLPEQDDAPHVTSQETACHAFQK